MPVEGRRHIHEHDDDEVGKVYEEGTLEESFDGSGDSLGILRLLIVHEVVLVVDVRVALLLLLA